MMEKETVLVGLSGGVDSAAAAVILQQQGYRVIGATMQIWDPSLPPRSARNLSKKRLFISRKRRYERN